MDEVETIMAFLISGMRLETAAGAFHPLRALVRALDKIRAERTQRLALNTLLSFDDARLDDLGINRQDLFDAMQADPVDRGAKLNARRARRARAALG